MVRATLLSLLLAACSSAPPASGKAMALVGQADEAASASDWPTARRLLEEASLESPGDAVVALRLARVQLEAFGDVEAADALYFRLLPAQRARALHGLGRCALWKGDEERALELWRKSLEERPTADCARDLAVRLMARGEPAGDVLDLVVEVSGQTLRSRLLLAAAGRLPRPERLPEGWTYALERARLLPLGADAAREVDLYLAHACATPGAREMMGRVLAGDFALRRNRPQASEVK